MKIPRHALSCRTVGELQSARAGVVSPSLAAGAAAAPYDAASDASRSFGEAFSLVNEARRQTDVAQDKVYATSEAAYYEGAVAEAKERHEKLSKTDPNWTPELFEKEMESIGKTFADGFKNYRLPENADAAQKVHDASRLSREVDARATATELQSKKVLSEYNQQYSELTAAASEAPVGERGPIYEQMRMMLEIGSSADGGAPILDPADATEKKTELEGLIKQDFYDAQAYDIYEAFIEDEATGDKMREDLQNSGLPSEDKAAIVSKLSGLMAGVDTAKAAKEERENFAMDVATNDLTNSWLADPANAMPSSEVAGWDVGDNPHALRKRREAFAVAYGIEQARSSVEDFGDGPWHDSEETRRAAEYKTRILQNQILEDAEADGIEITERQAYITAAALVARKHNVVPQSAARELSAVADDKSFAASAPLAVALLDQGAHIDINAGDYAHDYRNIHAMASTMERGTADASALAESYYQARMERGELEEQELQKRWEGKTLPNGEIYDSELQNAYSMISAGFVREALDSEMGFGWDALYDDTRERFFKELQAIGVEAYQRAFIEELPAKSIRNAVKLAIKNSGNIAVGLNVDEDGDAMHEAFVGIPKITSTRQDKRVEGGITETDHGKLRELLIDKELGGTMDVLGPDVKLRFQEGDSVQTLKLGQIDQNKLHLIPHRMWGKPTEYRLFVRDDNGLLNPVDMVIPTETGEASHSVWLNTEIETAQAYTQAATDLDDAYEAEVRQNIRKSMVVPHGIRTITLPVTPDLEMRRNKARQDRIRAEQKVQGFNN